jgi:hypothetical protein
MNRLHVALKSRINNMRCSEHNQQTEVKITGDKISFDCCCDSFRNKTKDVIAKVTKDFIETELRNAFKGH